MLYELLGLRYAGGGGVAPPGAASSKWFVWAEVHGAMLFCFHESAAGSSLRNRFHAIVLEASRILTVTVLSYVHCPVRRDKSFAVVRAPRMDELMRRGVPANLRRDIWMEIAGAEELQQRWIENWAPWPVGPAMFAVACCKLA